MTLPEATEFLSQPTHNTPADRSRALMAHAAIMDHYATPGNNGGEFNRALAGAIAALCRTEAMSEYR